MGCFIGSSKHCLFQNFKMGNSPVAKVMCVNNTNLELATLDLEVTRSIIQVGQARVEVCNLIMKTFYQDHTTRLPEL